jgi:integrase
MKGIYLRGQKYWYRTTLHGVQIRVPLETDDESDAIRKALDMRGNPSLLPGDPIRQEVKTYADRQFRLNHFSERTRDEVIRTIGTFFDFSEIGSAHQITTPEIQRWYDWLKTDRQVVGNDGAHRRDALTEESAQTYVARLSGFLRHLAESRKVRRNCAEGVVMAKLIPKARRLFCKKSERDQLVENCPRDDIKFVLYAGFHAGLRKGEIIEARGSWFDLEERLIHVPVTKFWKSKNGLPRTIPLTDAFRAFLLEAKMFQHSLECKIDYMLAPKVAQGRYRYRWDFRRPYKEYIDSHGMSWITPHVMRKTFGSTLATSGVSFLKISAWIGDDIRTTINNYAFLQPKDRDIERAFSDAVGGDSELEEPFERALLGRNSGRYGSKKTSKRTTGKGKPRPTSTIRRKKSHAR